MMVRHTENTAGIFKCFGWQSRCQFDYKPK